MQNIQITHEELMDVTVQEFAALLARQVQSTARYRAGMAAAEQQIVLQEDELESLRTDNVTMRQQIEALTAERDRMRDELPLAVNED